MLEQQSKSNTTALSIYSAPSWFEMLFEVYPKRKSLSYEVGFFFFCFRIMHSIIRTPLWFNEWCLLWVWESWSQPKYNFKIWAVKCSKLKSFLLVIPSRLLLGNCPQVDLHLKMFSATIYSLQVRTASSS